MGRKLNKGGRKNQKANQKRNKSQSNFLPSAGPGCYIARKDQSPEWLIEWEEVKPEEFVGEEVPDIAIDPEEHTLSLCNVDTSTKIAYITVFETRILAANHSELPLGVSIDNQGQSTPCVTFIVICPPCTFAHLCFLDVSAGQDISQIRIDSDVQKWDRHPKPQDEHPQHIGFPLQGGPFLCTQGEAGVLTHFFSGNLHAIDFRCPIGTPLSAVADGTVVDAKATNTLTGIAVSNLFEWNSIILKLDSNGKADSDMGRPLFVEYVHIESAAVKVGDRVKRGQVIGSSGSVGFSPEPHLHFSAFRSAEPTAPTVRVRFERTNDREEKSTFLPRAGLWYNSKGVVDPPPA